MKISHVLYKVDNLEKAVEDFRKQGYIVEYGSEKDPHNALIYFSEGPYIELITDSNMPLFIKIMLTLFGKKPFVDSMEKINTHKEGYMRFAIDGNDTDFIKEKKIFKQYKRNIIKVPIKRVDVKNRILKCKCLFPFDSTLPFIKTQFNINPRPKNFIHPNGAKKIKKVRYGTSSEDIQVIKKLCSDKILEVYVGEHKMEVEIQFN